MVGRRMVLSFSLSLSLQLISGICDKLCHMALQFAYGLECIPRDFMGWKLGPQCGRIGRWRNLLKVALANGEIK
jgi:hypothetical protein